MDSPESTKILASSSPSPKESPFFDYLRSLSPIEFPRVAHITRGFSELNIPTPPPVFTSPRLNPQADTIFLKRPQYPNSSHIELSHEHEDRCNIHRRGSDVSGPPGTQLMAGLVPCSKKERQIIGSMLVHTSSPSQCVDVYLADPEMDGATSSEAADIDLQQVNDAPKMLQSGCTRSKEAAFRVDDASDQLRKDTETVKAAKLVPSDQTCEDQQENPQLLVNYEQKDSERLFDLNSDQHDILLSDSSLEPPLCATNCHTQDVNQQSTESEQNGERDRKVQMAGQAQRGTRRRCLQFEAAEARRKSTSKSHCISNPAKIPLSRIPASLIEVRSSDSSHLDVAVTGSQYIVDSSQPMNSKLSLCPAITSEVNVSKVDAFVGNSDNIPRKAPLSSGIGLHLNSIVNSSAMGSSAATGMNSAEIEYPNTRRGKSPSLVEQLEETKSGLLPTNVRNFFSAKINTDHRESWVISADTSANFQFSQEKADRFEELNQPSPKSNRKRTTFTPENDGCKRCNCRRSRCLKLYCECFAAGIYCAEPCACQGCFNKPEYEDTVLETRQQIQSRNPLAFAPKVVRRVAGSPANSGENDNRVTPSSARHKRGCNCKKSMCLKKYCECYQSGVGCSDGCRCEGCKNIFGAKEGYGNVSEKVFKKADDENWEDLSDKKLVLASKSNFVQAEHLHPGNLTPATPLFQHSNHAKDVSKSWFPATRCLLSPESDTNILSSYQKSPRSPRTSGFLGSRAKTGEGSMDILFYEQEVEFSATGRVDQFSPRWDGLEDICNLTPLRQTPSKVTAIPSSSNTSDSAKVSRVQLQGSLRFSGSLRWRSSPSTPGAQFGGNKLRQEPSTSGYEILEDDTPDILKDTHTPIKAVKVSSPNQKRISPPHAPLNELRSTISPSLRSGRKFVLQSISSFPPLSPYSDRKGSSSDK